MKVHESISGHSFFITAYPNVGSAVLKGRNIIAVYRDGIGLSKIKTFGLPANKEAVYFTLTGVVLVNGASEPGTVTRILYQNAIAES